MKHSPKMNFPNMHFRVNTGLALAFALLLMTSVQQAMAQEEPSTTSEPAAAEPGTGDPAAAETTAMGEPPAVVEPATTLDRIRANGSIHLGYRTDAQPFSFRDAAGAPSGYSVALCAKIAEQVKTELGLSSLPIEWVEVGLDSRFSDLDDGKVDLLCGADTVTLSRREEVSFSLPIFPGGVGALVRTDTATRLQLVLEGRPVPNQPLWRGYPAQVLQHKAFSAVADSTSETWLAERINKLGIIATPISVESYDAGIAQIVDGSSDVLFGDRAILLSAAKRNPSAGELKVLERQFTVEPIALGLMRGDDDFRLLVDRTLSSIYSAPGFAEFFAETFGEPNERVLLFYLTNTLPE